MEVGRERPIFFDAESVKAILANKKSQTRRVLKDQPIADALMRERDGSWWDVLDEPIGPYRCPHGKPGDRLWVRETWAWHHKSAPDKLRPVFRADWHEPSAKGLTPADLSGWGMRWKSSLHLPRELSRILLEITDVRVERLQAIADEDCEAEAAFGNHDWDCQSGHDMYHHFDPDQTCKCGQSTPQEVFARRWDSINGKRPGATWEDNPFVWAISFKRVEASHAS
jgi:hypothetical protein